MKPVLAESAPSPPVPAGACPALHEPADAHSATARMAVRGCMSGAPGSVDANHVGAVALARVAERAIRSAGAGAKAEAVAAREGDPARTGIPGRAIVGGEIAEL